MELAIAAGGSLLSASFEKLFDVLASPELRQFVCKTEVDSELHNWVVMLPKIHAVLEDAHEKQNKSQFVNIWLSELKDLVYDVEDVLDEFATEALRLKLKGNLEAASSGHKVTKLLPFRFISERSRLKFLARMGSKLKDITGRMETISTLKSNLDLGERAVGGGRESSEITTTRTPTTSLPDTHFFGRDNDKNALLDLLLADGADVASVSVIPIQGMGGLGKTTLAQQLYNDDSVKLRFHLRAWACVSDTFDILTVTKTILQSLGGGTCEGMNLDQLQVSLEKTLSDKIFLIVLDDVWNEKYEYWTILYKPFRRGAPGSKIIVTTRNREVAELSGTTPAYQLEGLSREDCVSLFSQHALGANNFDGYPYLKDIGEKIVEKCKGLPLAAKTLGGLLRTKLQQRNEWVNILESPIWHLPEEKSDILPALRLSYQHLPPKLKQCFAYCALFPKDYEFDMDELILLWMAEGFLSSHPKRNKRLEDVGAQYFNALLSRSFFQVSSEDCARFVMHDLIHDVAQVVAGDTCFHLVDSVDTQEKFPTLRAHYSSFIRKYVEVSTRFEVFDQGKRLRTLLALPVEAYCTDYIAVGVLDKLLSKLRNLRALSLSGYRIRDVPGCVNGLKHLRYLNLSATLITVLPDFVCSLLNLQTLLLTYCEKLEKLPSRIGNLPNLCHLDIRQTRMLKDMPTEIGNLTELQSLGKFIVGLPGVGGLNIKELKNLSKLKGELSLEGLQNVEKSQDARDADLKGKEGLKMLAMRWNCNPDVPIPNENVAAEVLELLQPHKNLETLVIEFYCGLKFPSWFGDPTLMSNVVKIELSNCWESTSMPCLGRLPKLKHLIVKGMKEIKSLGDEFYGSDGGGGFQSLETLKLLDMQGLERWCLCGNNAVVGECGCKLPNLLELVIVNCPVLVGQCLVSLPCLDKLKLQECDESILRCMIDMNSLKTLSIEAVSGLSCLHDSTVGQLLVGLEDLKINNCEHLLSVWQSECHHQIIDDKITRLRSLEVRSCPNLVSFLTTRTMKKMTSLERLIVAHCPRICSAVQVNDRQEKRNDDEVKSSERLKHIELSNCGDELVECVVNVVMLGGEESFSVDSIEIESCDTLQYLAIKSTRGGNKVRYLRIVNCKNLVSISNRYEAEGMNIVVEIDELCIRDCPSLTSDGMKLLVSVRKLNLQACSKIESVADESIMASTVVEDICICDCPNLKKLPDWLHQLTNLTSLVLRNCDGLESFPERGLPVRTLTSLDITECKNLKSGPKNMQNMTMLKHLVVSGLKSFAEEGGLPPNLISLRIRGCPNVKPQMLEQLTSLEVLRIGGDMSLIGMLLLPAALKTLRIFGMKKLEIISSASPSSSSKSLHLHKNVLTSLTTLRIWNCPKLRELPKEGLPPTLEELWIRGCPILENKCVKEKGKYWPRISLIPQIDMPNV